MSKMNLPNRLTILRILMVPLFIACFYLHEAITWWNWLAAVIFFVADMTDVVDGHIARSRNLVTNFGKLMDPIADKLLFCSAFILLTWRHELPAILCIVFIVREFAVSGFRLVAVSSGKVIAANKIGKLKAALQVVGILLMILENPIFRLWNIRMDLIVMIVAAVVAVWSGLDYIIRNWKAVDWN